MQVYALCKKSHLGALSFVVPNGATKETLFAQFDAHRESWFGHTATQGLLRHFNVGFVPQALVYKALKCLLSTFNQ